MILPERIKRPEKFQNFKKACNLAGIPCIMEFDYERDDEREYHWVEIQLVIKPSVQVILGEIKVEKGNCRLFGSDLSDDLFKEMDRLAELFKKNASLIRQAA